MTLIRLTRPSGLPVWIAPEAITRLYRDGPLDNAATRTVIHMGAEEQLVRELPDTVLAAMAAGGRP